MEHSSYWRAFGKVGHGFGVLTVIYFAGRSKILIIRTGLGLGFWEGKRTGLGDEDHIDDGLDTGNRLRHVGDGV
ncbi:hypothetical protein M430DRAFT_34340 [Amorphotheca resinae ATCC 22711]|jgi:hypothetical protein|uniref:Uncharacterized protein n=1 Tax=Amorphotheca resinae ATCC 22711 TaxID=857342 RepID=A0A2T3B6X7_AMORE|nr:hypothetical protein M430DRAFT_34340 [Amorphotheca resinae ATCC 22711]PSS22492.1 hypothetical protein M430DRAFT_34340 [Amorphotheca resinae ATCC 22711]